MMDIVTLVRDPLPCWPKRQYGRGPPSSARGFPMERADFPH